MDYEITSEEITIVPKSKPLSNSELIKQRNAVVKEVKFGSKRNVKLGTKAEKDELKKLNEKLIQSISAPNINSIAGRIQAIWDDKENLVRVVKKKGKMDQFGFMRNGYLYLEFFEALFLLETNRLQLEYYNMVLSIEQSYILLLGEEISNKFTEYAVYVTLTKIGYILVKYKNSEYNKTYAPVSRTDCIFALLNKELHNTEISNEIAQSKYFIAMKQGMEENKKFFRENRAIVDEDDIPQCSNAIRINFCKRQRSAKLVDSNEEIPFKQFRFSPSPEITSHLDELKTTPAYEKFKTVFEKFDIIHLKTDIICAENCRKLNISFDMYLHEGFRKSMPGPPLFRIVILNTEEPFPSHDEILLCYRQQLHPAPLLMVTVSPSNKLNGFHCTFT